MVELVWSLVVQSIALVQGTNLGFRPCVYNSGGVDKADYSRDTGVKVLWLIFWTIQQAWLVSFSSVMGQAMFPK